MVVDRFRVDRLLAEIEGHVRLLEESRASEDNLLADRLRLHGVLYTFQCAIEGVTAICHHIVAEGGLRLPRDTKDAAGILAQEGVIGTALAARLPEMFRFPNLLVHRYWKVDAELVGDILAHDLDDFRTFAREITEWLDEQAAGG